MASILAHKAFARLPCPGPAFSLDKALIHSTAGATAPVTSRIPRSGGAPLSLPRSRCQIAAFVRMSFITCVPTSSVPTHPKSTQAQGFTSRRNRKSETSCQLPGGRIVESCAASSRPTSPLRELLTRPSTTSRLEKKARNILKATACETMPHCGMILASVRNSFFARELSPIARNYIGFRRIVPTPSLWDWQLTRASELPSPT